MILSLDASTKATGYAIFDNNKLITYGCWKSSKEDVIERIKYMVEKISTIIDQYYIVKIYLEEVLPKVESYDDQSLHHAKPSVFKPLMWLQAAIVFLIHNKNIEINFVMPNTWRASLGIQKKGLKRDALKAADCDYVLKNFGIAANDDICDAIALGWSQIIQDFNWE